ncbi:MAG TPA: hypothetical protein VEI50_15980 [Nitrospiraceae bacterium]|nr:hypothetical protein [Nitrospiraceae bacterium]
MSRTYLDLLIGIMVLGLSACGVLSTEQVVYDQQGFQVGIELDPTIKRSREPVQNNHPAKFSPTELQAILGMIEVSGWSGTLMGLLAPPRPVPLFKDEELREVAPHLATAFRGAGPTERIFFSLVNRQAPYRDERTAGALFLRGPYLHVVVRDHMSVIATDTGGSDQKDIRDTKSMKLWVVHPANAAMVPDAEEPRWDPFESVHISVKPREVLALREARLSSTASRPAAAPLIKVTPQLDTKDGQMSSPASLSPEDLQLQIKELTSSNLDLRKKIEEQTRQMKDLADEMERLRQELEKAKSKRPSPRSAPSQ